MTVSQLTIDFDRCELTRHLVDRGIRGLAAEIVIMAAMNVKLVRQDGLLRLPWRVSERAAAQLLGVSKSGLREAVERLTRRGVVTRGRGLLVVEWSALLELPEVDPLADLPPLPREADKWSVDGRLLVGSLEEQEQETLPTNQPIQTQTQRARYQETDQQPTDRPSRLPFVLRWRHLFHDDRRPNREGIVRLHLACVELGWIPHVEPLAEFAETLGLVLWLDTRERREAGVEHPLSWLIAALRDGREKLMSWPGDEFFERAQTLVARAEGLDRQLQITKLTAEKGTACTGSPARILR